MALGSSRNDCHICQNHVIGGAWPWLCRHELQENAAQAAKRRSMLEHRKSARANAVRRAWLGAVVLLAGLGVLTGRTLADAECGETEAPKATKGAWPAGYKYSAKKKG